MAYLYLCLAICAEVCATLALPHVSANRLTPLSIVVPGYVIAFGFLNLALKSISVAAAYAIWSGAGIILVSLGGWLLMRQSVDPRAIAGMGFIILGIVLVKSAAA